MGVGIIVFRTGEVFLCKTQKAKMTVVGHYVIRKGYENLGNFYSYGRW